MIENNNQDDLIIDKISPHVMSKLQKKKIFLKKKYKISFLYLFYWSYIYNYLCILN